MRAILTLVFFILFLAHSRASLAPQEFNEALNLAYLKGQSVHIINAISLKEFKGLTSFQETNLVESTQVLALLNDSYRQANLYQTMTLIRMENFSKKLFNQESRVNKNFGLIAVLDVEVARLRKLKDAQSYMLQLKNTDSNNYNLLLAVAKKNNPSLAIEDKYKVAINSEKKLTNNQVNRLIEMLTASMRQSIDKEYAYEKSKYAAAHILHAFQTELKNADDVQKGKLLQIKQYIQENKIYIGVEEARLIFDIQYELTSNEIFSIANKIYETSESTSLAMEQIRERLDSSASAIQKEMILNASEIHFEKLKSNETYTFSSLLELLKLEISCNHLI